MKDENWRGCYPAVRAYEHAGAFRFMSNAVKKGELHSLDIK
jgi:hypothetical protein